MKKPSTILFIALALIIITISSCKKVATVANIQTASDAITVGLHMDAAMEDVANVVSKSRLSGSASMIDTVAGGAIDTSQIASGIITVTYDGITTVDNRFIRSGKMVIQLVNFPASTWTTQNAVLNITFDTLKYTNSASGASFTYNGLHILTNLSSGLGYQMLAGNPVATVLGAIRYRHTSSAASVTFPDGSNLSWNINRIITYTNTGNNPNIAISSDHVQNDSSYVEIWGMNRQGYQFYNAVVSPVYFNNKTCSTSDFRDPMSGECRQYEQTFNIKIIFGINADGTPSIYCPYGYQTDYINSKSVPNFSVIQYWY